MTPNNAGERMREILKEFVSKEFSYMGRSFGKPHLSKKITDKALSQLLDLFTEIVGEKTDISYLGEDRDIILEKVGWNKAKDEILEKIEELQCSNLSNAGSNGVEL